MKVKNTNLKWNVLRYDSNLGKVENYNIFYSDFAEKLHTEIVKRKKIKNYEELKEYVNRWAKYHFWSKCECEIYVGYFYTKEDEFEKIDIYRQIEMNLDNIIEYIIRKLDIKF